ncbi:MAG: hypothetical protein AAF849_23100 [Bacteroidota bacterium]
MDKYNQFTAWKWVILFACFGIAWFIIRPSSVIGWIGHFLLSLFAYNLLHALPEVIYLRRRGIKGISSESRKAYKELQNRHFEEQKPSAYDKCKELINSMTNLVNMERDIRERKEELNNEKWLIRQTINAAKIWQDEVFNSIKTIESQLLYQSSILSDIEFESLAKASLKELKRIQRNELNVFPKKLKKGFEKHI